MGFSDLLVELEEKYGLNYQDPNFEQEFAKIEFRQQVDEWLATSRSEPILRDFLGVVVPPKMSSKWKYWLFCQDGNGVAYQKPFIAREEYITACETLCDKPVNLFFSPCVYNGYHNNSHTVSTNCIYIDIDDIEDFDVAESDIEDIVKYITEKYTLSVEMLPNYIIKSGHGLHLYYRISNTMCDEKRERIVNKITAYFDADFANVPASHFVRVPCSINIKRTHVQSELFQISDTTNDIDYLDKLFVISKDEIRSRKEAYNNKIKEKRNATRALHKAQESNVSKPQKNSEIKETVNHKDDDDYNYLELYDIFRSGDTDLLPPPKPCCKLSYRKDYYKGYNNHNLQVDLHNYFVRHNGNIVGCRNNFIMILSTVLRHLMDREQAIDYCSQYFDDDFYDEMERTVTHVYTCPIRYRYSNLKIAALLHFSQKDIDESYLAFSEDRKKAANRERVARYRRSHGK